MDPIYIADLKFIFSLPTLWLIEVDLRKWDKRGIKVGRWGRDSESETVPPAAG